MVFGDSVVLPGAQNGEKCKMTHYYCTRTTLGHLILHPKSIPEFVKWHQNSTPKCEISLVLGEFLQDVGEIHEILGDFW